MDGCDGMESLCEVPTRKGSFLSSLRSSMLPIDLCDRMELQAGAWHLITRTAIFHDLAIPSLLAKSSRVCSLTK